MSTRVAPVGQVGVAEEAEAEAEGAVVAGAAVEAAVAAAAGDRDVAIIRSLVRKAVYGEACLPSLNV